MTCVVHITHEAMALRGGLGAVIRALVTTDAYRAFTHRTVLVQPLDAGSAAEAEQLAATGAVRPLDAVEAATGARVFHGRTWLRRPDGAEAEVEVVLCDARRASAAARAEGAEALARVGVDLARFAETADFELWVCSAGPAIAALRAIGALDDGGGCLVLGHDYMGVPGAVCARKAGGRGVRAALYAHEVFTCRYATEVHPGLDVTFRNAFRRARETGLSLSDVFGPTGGLLRHQILRAAARLDGVIAVSETTGDELRWLEPEFAAVPIRAVWNGIAPPAIDAAEREAARDRLRRFAAALVGFTPDVVLSHVARLVRSKALWRDVLVLHALDEHLAATDRRAVLFLQATDMADRAPAEIEAMAAYGWPAVHRLGAPDLSDEEAAVYHAFEKANASLRRARCVLVNQFRWERERLGPRCPEDMPPDGLHAGTDVEFAQSVYEPFGLSPLEAMVHGALCVISTGSGCLERLDGAPGVIVADYAGRGADLPLPALVRLDRRARTEIERAVATTVAAEIAGRLPPTMEARAEQFAAARAFGATLTPERAARNAIIPALASLLR